jgi:sugar fermentation stimulation protein A
MSPDVDFPEGTFEARFLRRPNRYLTFCEAPDGAELRCFCPDPGRLAEFTTPGRRVLVAPAPAGALARRTTHTQVAFHHGGEWVSILTAKANALAREAWEGGLLPEIPPGTAWRPEVKHGESRIDFLAGDTLVEVKSVTLVVDGEARFPDAPTLRGARHVRELASHAREGGRAMLVFVQQREAGARVRPNDATDPAFGAALRDAQKAGVVLAAVACRVDLSGVVPVRRIPVLAEA